MKTIPSEIIAITIRRYLDPPLDQQFWKEYTKINPSAPDQMLALLEKHIDLLLIEGKPLMKGDLLMVNYIRSLDQDAESFPITETLLEYKKCWFTPDDNDFYNRVIYEKEIEQLKQDITNLRKETNAAIKAKRDFIMRDYELVSHLGNGGFGMVSLVKHTLSKTLFAIKRLHSKSADDQKNIQREIDALAPLNHVNIIRYQHSFYANEFLYLVMEHCSGGSLAERLSLKGSIAEDELVTLFLDLTKAFGYLHKKGIIHHDIKPSNILFTGDGIIKISDFGCVNSSIGTKVYYAPELYLSTDYISDPRTDIFSLGVTLMECALGYNPFDNKSIDEKELMLKQANLPIRNLPFWLQDTIFKAVSIDLNARFQTMDEFHSALVHKNIPKFLTSELISLEKDANRLDMLIKTRKWIKAGNFISTHPKVEQNLNLLINSGKFYLKTHQIEKARGTFEKALHINPHAHIEKQLAEVYLQKGETSKATTILTNYINQNFNDIEAHNQLLHAYFLSSRWELGQEQAELASKIFPNDEMIQDNLALFEILNDRFFYGNKIISSPFWNYNINVFENNNPVVWSRTEKPFLQTKMLFHEYKFHEISNSSNAFEIQIDGKLYCIEDHIVAFGRKGYVPFAFSSFSGNEVSRLHFVIINQKNNVWLYDLDSFSGVYVDGKKVYQKYFLLGLHNIQIGDHKISLKTDRNLLI